MNAFFASAWSPYQGQRGGRGWKNSATGEVRYQADRPDDPGSAAPATTGTPSRNQPSPQAARVAPEKATLMRNIQEIKLTPSQAKALNHFFKLGNFSNLSEMTRLRHAHALYSVCSKLPEKSVELIVNNVRQFKIVENTRETNAEFKKQTNRNVEKGFSMMGFYSVFTGAIVCDGYVDRPGADPQLVQRGVWAHELGHAIDGSFELSKSTDWQSAFDQEIKSGGLSEYATTSPQEGFAEFSRLIYGSDVERESAVGKFPLCAKFFGKRGLL